MTDGSPPRDALDVLERPPSPPFVDPTSVSTARASLRASLAQLVATHAGSVTEHAATEGVHAYRDAPLGGPDLGESAPRLTLRVSAGLGPLGIGASLLVIATVWVVVSLSSREPITSLAHILAIMGLFTASLVAPLCVRTSRTIELSGRELSIGGRRIADVERVHVEEQLDVTVLVASNARGQHVLLSPRPARHAHTIACVLQAYLRWQASCVRGALETGSIDA